MNRLSYVKAIGVVSALAIPGVLAESHTIIFTNNCGFGTPMLIQGSNVLSTGGPFTSNGPINSAIAYLQTGACGLNGEGCSVVETTLSNKGSSTSISQIPPHKISVTTGFAYFNGCDGTGSGCTNPTCPFPGSPSGQSQNVTCSAPNVDLAITFCD